MRTTAYTVTIGAHLETELVASVRLPRGEMKLHTLQQHNLVLEETNQAVAITPVTVSPQYLHDDYLKLRVSAIVYSTPLLPLTLAWQDSLSTTQSGAQFTLTEYSKRKQFDNRYYSPPFTTSPQGYRLCLNV